MRIGGRAVLLLSVVVMVADPDAARGEPLACQRAIVRATSKLAQVEVAALAKCETARLNGSLPLATDCRTEPDTAATLADARADLGIAVAKACGGDDRTCDAVGDDSLATIGWDLGTCPNLNDGPCTNALAGCDDVATCVACLAETGMTETLALVHRGFAPALPGTADRQGGRAVRRGPHQGVSASNSGATIDPSTVECAPLGP